MSTLFSSWTKWLSSTSTTQFTNDLTKMALAQLKESKESTSKFGWRQRSYPPLSSFLISETRELGTNPLKEYQNISNPHNLRSIRRKKLEVCLNSNPAVVARATLLQFVTQHLTPHKFTAPLEPVVLRSSIAAHQQSQVVPLLRVALSQQWMRH